MTVPGTRVVQHPVDHPYLRHLGLVPDGSTSAPSVWDVDALAAAEVDVVHLHFGFEHLGADELDRWVERLRRADIALVHTVHDLDNPHLVDQRDFHRSVGVLTAAAAAVLTLTETAATQIADRYGRFPIVVAHPHVVPLADLRPSRRDGRARGGVYVHAATVRPNLDVDLLLGLIPAARAVGGLRLHVRDSVPAPFRQWLHRVTSEAGAVVEVGPRLTDDELWDRIGGAALVALPYRWGTHSGLLEAARDLGTPTLAPAFGGYRDQGAHVIDGADLAGSVSRAAATPPVVDPEDRRGQRDAASLVHAELYAALARPVGMVHR
ncbi:MAG: hypothetical protein ABW195_17160 [Ilumatobacteraceae bacterium]